MRTIELSERVDQSIRRALDEDIGPGDATTDSIIPADASLRGQIVAKQSGEVAGLEVARRVFFLLSEQVNFEVKVEEGAQVEKRTVLVDLYGPARALLTGERTALFTNTNPIRRAPGVGRRQEFSCWVFARDQKETRLRRCFHRTDCTSILRCARGRILHDDQGRRSTRKNRRDLCARPA